MTGMFIRFPCLKHAPKINTELTEKRLYAPLSFCHLRRPLFKIFPINHLFSPLRKLRLLSSGFGLIFHRSAALHLVFDPNIHF